MSKSTEAIEVVISFDTTGSMYPALTQVRRTVKENVRRLFKEIPNIRIGIIAHGDYCDAGRPYVTSQHDLSTEEKSICRFVEEVKPTGGGDMPECYELVLYEARTKMSWTSGKTKVLAMIGDDIPHPAHYPGNTLKLDWRNELGLLLESGVHVYGVQALNRGHATHFYQEIAKKTGGFHLNLDQFNAVTDLIMAICYKQAGDGQLQAFEKEILEQHRMTRSMDQAFATLLNRKVSSDFGATDLHAVPSGRFQVLEVDKDSEIRSFAEDNGLKFQKGRGFYQHIEATKVQDYKEIILMEKKSGDFFSGDKARELLGLPKIGTVSLHKAKSNLDKYVTFVQSTSVNRKLKAGTKFLYEVADWAS